jgi:hypothetical protein
MLDMSQTSHQMRRRTTDVQELHQIEAPLRRL